MTEQPIQESNSAAYIQPQVEPVITPTSNSGKYLILGGIVILLMIVIMIVFLLTKPTAPKQLPVNTFTKFKITPEPTFTPTPTTILKTEYNNPFDSKSQYENPFSESNDYKNPFTNE